MCHSSSNLTYSKKKKKNVVGTLNISFQSSGFIFYLPVFVAWNSNGLEKNNNIELEFMTKCKNIKKAKKRGEVRPRLELFTINVAYFFSIIACQRAVPNE